ncbi:Uncharacterized conserved protein, contains Mth938-like domain [Cohaesibacter marisflavi]|uniref:Uncharacterized conserved protein, contains Mth938-like domain n=2 Tax=Cohaesibacter marisflavi TaxID=655353 RepID=A0A1I5IAS0_9HYPH|nr:Uncharacterized conserved protein, contains Mth938-like domain [Cohaesibacter marisflavi]
MVFKWLQGKKASPNLKDNSHAGETTSGVDTDPTVETDQDTMAPASGLEMTDAYYPGHDPIDFYGNGGFRFGEMSHQGAILFLPSGVHRWDVETVNALTTDHFAKLLAESRDIELLILGTGNLIVPLAQSLANHMRQAGIKLDIMNTGAAVRTLNILLSEDRAVAAALFPVS